MRLSNVASVSDAALGPEEAGAAAGHRAADDVATRLDNSPDPVAALARALDDARETGRCALLREGATEAYLAGWIVGFDRGSSLSADCVRNRVARRQGEPVPEFGEVRLSRTESTIVERVATQYGVADLDKYRILIGLRTAWGSFVPRIQSGAFGSNAPAILASLALVWQTVEQDQAETRESPLHTRRQREIMYLGVLAGCEHAIVAAVARQAAHAAAFGALASSGSAARQLRPGDFGALPSPPRMGAHAPPARRPIAAADTLLAESRRPCRREPGDPA